MALRYWVGGTDTWNNTAGSKWSATSGGAGGASAPTNADDVFFNDKNAPNWAASTAYTLGQIRSPLATGNGFFYEVTTAGTSAATEPTWPTVVGNTVADGTVTWTCRLATVTTASNATCLTANFTGFTGTLNAATNWNVQTSLTFGSAMTITGTGNITKPASGGTWTFNGKTYTGGWVLPSGGGFSTTIGDNLIFNGTISGPISNCTLTATSPRNITIGGGFASMVGGINLTNIDFILNGTGNLVGAFTRSSGNGSITINAPGFTISHNATLSLANMTFTYTAGTFNSTSTISFGGIVSANVMNNVSTLTFSAMSFLSAGGQSVTLNSDMYVSGNLSGAGATGAVNGSKLFIGGSITNTLTGTSTIEMYGSNSVSLAPPIMQNNLTINKSGGATVTLSSFTWGLANRTLQLTAGNINQGSSTITLSGTPLTINGMIFNSLTIPTGTTINQNTTNTISGTLVCSGSATFAGTEGWNAFNFTTGGAGSIITLQEGITYNVSGLFTMVGTAANRVRLQSSLATDVTVTIISLSNQMSVSVGSIPNPAAGFVLGSRAFSNQLPAALINLLPDRPTIASGSASPYTLVNPIGVTGLTLFAGQVGKKAFFNVTGTTPMNVLYAETRDIDSSGGISIYAQQSFADSTSTPNLFRTINWVTLVAPSGSAYYTFVC